MLIQNPPLWLFKALGIVVGLAPQRLEPDIMPAVDALQGGLGVAKWRTAFIQGTLVGNTFFEIPEGDFDHAVIVRYSATNGGTANVLVTETSTAEGNQVIMHVANLPAANSLGWATGYSGGQQFRFVPPGFSWRLQLAAGTTTAPVAVIHYALVPAGSKPF